MSEDIDDNEDDGLGPMVDCLSGALCVIVLVVIVFIMSSIDTLFASQGLRFAPSVLDSKKKVVYYVAGVELSAFETFKIKKDIESTPLDKRVVIYGASRDVIKSGMKKNIYNTFTFRDGLNLKRDVDISLNGDVSVCNEFNSCIYWRVE